MYQAHQPGAPGGSWWIGHSKAIHLSLRVDVIRRARLAADSPRSVAIRLLGRRCANRSSALPPQQQIQPRQREYPVGRPGRDRRRQQVDVAHLLEQRPDSPVGHRQRNAYANPRHRPPVAHQKSERHRDHRHDQRQQRHRELAVELHLQLRDALGGFWSAGDSPGGGRSLLRDGLDGDALDQRDRPAHGTRRAAGGAALDGHKGRVRPAGNRAGAGHPRRLSTEPVRVVATLRRRGRGPWDGGAGARAARQHDRSDSSFTPRIDRFGRISPSTCQISAMGVARPSD